MYCFLSANANYTVHFHEHTFSISDVNFLIFFCFVMRVLPLLPPLFTVVPLIFHIIWSVLLFTSTFILPSFNRLLLFPSIYLFILVTFKYNACFSILSSVSSSLNRSDSLSPSLHLPLFVFVCLALISLSRSRPPRMVSAQLCGASPHLQSATKKIKWGLRRSSVVKG